MTVDTFDAYLEWVSINRDTTRKAQSVWRTLRDTTGRRLPTPSACTGPDGAMFCCWDDGAHHLEIEIFPARPAEYFYRNRETGELAGDEFQPDDSLPAQLVAMLWLFVKEE